MANEYLNTEAPGSRYSNYKNWETLKNAPYDYESKGLNKYILSKSLVESTNPITQYILAAYEAGIVFVLKYVDELKNFKNVHWKNR